MILKKIKKKYDYLIFETYKIPNEALAIYRMLFAVISIFIIGYPNATWLSNIPTYFYRPQLLNISHFIAESMPSFEILFLISWLPIIFLVCIFFGYRTRWASLGLGLLLIVQGAFESSLGKIDHGILYPLCVLIMGFSGWEKCYSLDSKANKSPKKSSGLAPFLLALSLGFAFFTAGYAKLTGGWLNWEQVGVQHHFFSNYEVWGRRSFFAPVFNEIKSHIFWKLQDYFVVVFECLFLIAVIFKRFFQYFIVLALIFHTSVLLMLNITITSIFVVYAVFLPWKQILQYLKSKRFTGYQSIIFRTVNFWISVILVSGIYFYFILTTPEDVLLSIFNMAFYSLEINYRILQAIIIYILSWSLLIWIYKNKKISEK